METAHVLPGEGIESPCFEPTYKEWKLLVDAVRIFYDPVLSLPTRNGNRKHLHRIFPSYPSFWAYLQGMETNKNKNKNKNRKKSFEPTYKEWKLFVLFSCFFNLTVLSLPTRNGNIFSLFYKKRQGLVLSLPTRNGNFGL